MKVLYLVLITLLVQSACSSKNELRLSSSKEDNLIQVSLSTVGKERDTSGAYAIEMNSNLVVNYYGGSNSGLSGNYVGKISSSDWNNLLKTIDKNKVTDTILPETATDDDFFDLSIKFLTKKYYIVGYFSGAPVNVKDLCEEIILIKNKIKFKKVSNDNVFEVKAFTNKRGTDTSLQFTVPTVR